MIDDKIRWVKIPSFHELSTVEGRLLILLTMVNDDSIENVRKAYVDEKLDIMKKNESLVEAVKSESLEVFELLREIVVDAIAWYENVSITLASCVYAGYYLLGLKQEEISERLCISQKAVDDILDRMKKVVKDKNLHD